MAPLTPREAPPGCVRCGRPLAATDATWAKRCLGCNHVTLTRRSFLVGASATVGLLVMGQQLVSGVVIGRMHAELAGPSYEFVWSSYLQFMEMKATTW
jgi:hypothetical protein